MSRQLQLLRTKGPVCFSSRWITISFALRLATAAHDAMPSCRRTGRRVASLALRPRHGLRLRSSSLGACRLRCASFFLKWRLGRGGALRRAALLVAQSRPDTAAWRWDGSGGSRSLRGVLRVRGFIAAGAFTSRLRPLLQPCVRSQQPVGVQRRPAHLLANAFASNSEPLPLRRKYQLRHFSQPNQPLRSISTLSSSRPFAVLQTALHLRSMPRLAYCFA